MQLWSNISNGAERNNAIHYNDACRALKQPYIWIMLCIYQQAAIQYIWSVDATTSRPADKIILLHQQKSYLYIQTEAENENFGKGVEWALDRADSPTEIL